MAGAAYVNRTSVRNMYPATEGTWDGQAEFELFKTTTTYTYYERTNTPPEAVLSSSDSTPAFIDMCTVDEDGASLSRRIRAREAFRSSCSGAA